MVLFGINFLRESGVKCYRRAGGWEWIILFEFSPKNLSPDFFDMA